MRSHLARAGECARLLIVLLCTAVVLVTAVTQVPYCDCNIDGGTVAAPTSEK